MRNLSNAEWNPVNKMGATFRDDPAFFLRKKFDLGYINPLENCEVLYFCTK
jgi:hypothetical protein